MNCRNSAPEAMRSPTLPPSPSNLAYQDIDCKFLVSGYVQVMYIQQNPQLESV